ncbi:MAG: cytochrome c biogenesis protein ResB, partial [Verrucomicrobiota bacterium]
MSPKRLLKVFTSLRLTVVLLAFGIILIFVGTLAQADEGLYTAQARYFKQWLVIGFTMFGKKIPMILPGGYLLGTLLLLNLIAAHIARFQFTVKKIGIHLAHGGIILLLVGQLATDIFSRETQMRFSQGETKSYSESPMDYELAFVTSSDATRDEEVLLPEKLLANGGEIKTAQMPFAVRVKQFWKNSEPSFRAPMMQNGPPLTTNGIANSFDFRSVHESKKMDEKNVPTALVEIVGPKGSLGEWIVSGWAGDETMREALANSFAGQMGSAMGQKITARLQEPQSIEVNGKKYTFTLRPKREYTPFSLTLLEAKHAVYRGTEIPKDFRSRVRLENPQTGENREVEIFMNSPLRYAGLTFYQYQMAAGEMAREAGRLPSSTLQVVHNPGWLTPYIGCALVGAGLVIQFLMHLVGFLGKRKRPGAVASGAVGAVPASAASASRLGMKTWLPVVLTGLMAAWFLGTLRPTPDHGFAYNAFGELPIVFNGRHQPLDSLARNSLLQIREKQTLNTEPWKSWNKKPKIIPAIEWLATVMMRPDVADQWPVFRIDNPDLISLLKLPGKDEAPQQDG